MPPNGTDEERQGKADEAEFELADGQIWAVRGGQRFCLGEAGSVQEAMAGFLGEMDFGEN